MATNLKTTLKDCYTRFKALVIDVFMIYTPILYIATYLFLGGKEAFQNNQVAILICFLLYALIDSTLCATLGQTPGMRAQNLVLQTKTHTKVCFFVCLLRFVLCFLSFALLFGFVFPFLRNDRQTFHDWLCRTQITDKPPNFPSNP
ncbi:hypothetical protein BBW65_07525 [Helicobacter enhydrae]|uniref:RDD domain-containing protein n=1 Tax=Helicobacter enhydrae TaxID=222136 RepID=A0A1B1U7D3_9HELI|nr:hypothetical protein BBW65_07525 [Helicobacter enhydrae]